MKDESGSSSGMGIGGVLLVVFVVLKLCGVIAWSWWWVLSPLWIGFTLAILIFAGVFVVANISESRDRKRRVKRILNDY